MGARNLQSDSKLVIGQIKEEYEVKEERIYKYLRLMKHLAQKFDRVEFVLVPQSQNTKANEIEK